MTRAEIVALFTQREAAWQRHDPDALAGDHLHEAVAISPMHGRIEGRTRIREVYQTWFSAFPDLILTTDDLIVDGDRAVHFFTIKGTQAAPFGGVQPTGRRISITGAWLYAFDDTGKIQQDRRLYDATSMMVQIGALRTKLPGD